MLPQSVIRPQYHYNPDAPTDTNDHACHHCGVIGELEALPGRPPHYKELRCTACGAFVKWLPKPRIDKGALPPTPKQLHYLKAMAFKGEKPATRREASRLIGEMKRARGWA